VCTRVYACLPACVYQCECISSCIERGMSSKGGAKDFFLAQEHNACGEKGLAV